MRVVDFLDRGFATAPDRLFLDGEGGSYTYREAVDFTHRLAHVLAKQGADENTSIAILTPNDVRGILCLFAIHRLGGVYARLNYRSAIEENTHIVKESGATWLFFHSDAASLIPEYKTRCPKLKHFVCLDREWPDAPDMMALAGTDKGAFPRLPESRDHVAMLASTGGTTGLPKLVMLTDLNLETAAAAHLSGMPATEPPVYLIASAMTHAASTIALGMIASAATLIILAKADPLEICQVIEARKVSHIYLPPTVIYTMLAHPDAGKFDYSSLRYFMYGAAPMSGAKLKQAMEMFGPVMAQFYGQAECPMFISILTPEDHARAIASGNDERLISAGKPTLLCSVAAMADDGSLVPVRERGEIVTRGNLVMKGYLNNEAATREASAHGWHHTGDIGYFDEEGYLYIVDRKRDLIISGGFNVYPGEVEQRILAHPAVQECAVIGVPHEKWGEEVRGIVTLKAGASASEAELIAWCKDFLGSLKSPKAFEFRESLPKSAAGKILKRDIRAPYWKGHERTI